MKRLVTPVLAGLLLIAAAVAGSVLPVRPVDAPALVAETPPTSVLCAPAPGAQVAVAASEPGATRSSLGDPDATTAVPGPAVVGMGAEPLRVAAPSGAVLGATVTALGDAGADRGLGAAPCVVPRADQWFTGVRAGANARAQLVLLNADAEAADVNLTAYGPGGRLAGLGGRGILVRGRTASTVDLGPILASDAPLVVRVETSAGRVGAVVRQTLFSGPDAVGADWLAAVGAPATSAIVAGVPSGGGPRDLVVGNPGDRTAEVRIGVLGGSGTVAPAGADRVSVPPQSTRTVSLTGGLRGGGGAVRVTSDQPVTASVEARSGTSVAQTDWASSGASPVVDGQVWWPLATASATRATVTLANPGATATSARVLVRAPDGGVLLDRAASVAAGASVEVAVPAADHPVATVTSSGQVHAAVVLSGKAGTADGLAWLGVPARPAAEAGVRVAADPRVGA